MTIAASEEPVFTFDRFIPGTSLGSVVQRVEPALLEGWSAIYTPTATQQNTPAIGLMSLLAMRAYLRIISPRPPGNIHAGQFLKASHPLSVGQTLRITVTCQDKELKGHRRFVVLAVRADDVTDEQEIFNARMTMLWAV